MQKKTFYITTPIFYTSGPLHIGHLYCTTIAWCIANYKRLLGYDVKFLTGSDEHGSKIEQKARTANKNTQDYVDELVASYKQMWKKWDIDYDYFSRTTNPYHMKTVQSVFSYFLKHGLIYKGKYEGLYSINDEEFLTKTQAVEKNGEYFHPVSGHKLINMSEESYFFKVSKFQQWWMDEVKKNPDWLVPQKMTNEMITNFMADGLEDLSVTRTNIKWGIPTIEAPEHILYVWLDALFNYVTALGFDLKKPSDDYLKYWANGNEIVHLVGKEISRFHFIYWTIFTKALGIRIPDKIFAHGLLRDGKGRKMSKSLNNVIEPDYLLNKYHNEMIKYYFASQVVLGEDSNFSEEKLIDVVNADLINNYGNLVSRTLKMINNSFPNGLFYKENNKKEHLEIENKILTFPKLFIEFMDKYKLDKAFELSINLSNDLNKYIDELKPWLLTNEADKDELEAILIRLLNGIYAVSCSLQIVMPNKMKEVARALNISGFEFKEIKNLLKFNNLKVSEKFILYNRIKK
ncbi:methionine--tRNA ligase [Mycoplasmopsis primatum]|uniref:methionine--tRNA ligase n=1 Tax=Mycoplasmopsis primatum TaxID=55604 RepID=UPI00049806BF|nr:methionine--tRNA ligase [Mycoplasmopsis primatum]